MARKFEEPDSEKSKDEVDFERELNRRLAVSQDLLAVAESEGDVCIALAAWTSIRSLFCDLAPWQEDADKKIFIRLQTCKTTEQLFNECYTKIKKENLYSFEEDDIKRNIMRTMALRKAWILISLNIKIMNDKDLIKKDSVILYATSKRVPGRENIQPFKKK